MYVRPRSIFEKFSVSEKVTRLSEIGRTVVEFKDTGKILFGVLSITTSYEGQKFDGLKHSASHYVVQRGAPKAKIGDMLVQPDRKFLVKSVENPAGLGQWTTYLVDERADI